MRTIFLIAFGANVVLTLAALAVLPDQVAIHFRLGGEADSWASKELHAIFFLVLEVYLFLVLWYAPSLTMKIPSRFISLPNKEYWLREENRPALGQKLQSAMVQFGTALYLFLFIVGLLTLQANLSQPVRLNEKAFLPALVLFLGYTAAWCISLFRAFRIPGEDG